MKKIFPPFVFLCILLLAGAGCKGNNTNTTPTSTVETPVVDTTVQQEAYLFCTQKGYNIQIRFVPGENKNIAYCVFDAKRECESVSFFKGSCSENPTPTSTEEGLLNMFEPGPGDIFPLRLCDPIAKPVCGKDNKTYTNPCIAQFLNVTVAHEGSCERPAVVAAEEPPTINDTPIIDVAKSPIAVISRLNSQKNKNWIEIPASLLKSSTDKNSSMQRCEINKTVTFLVKTGCPSDCFSTLYNAAGEVMCYPDHDISGTCPAYIASSEYKSSCTKVTEGTGK